MKDPITIDIASCMMQAAPFDSIIDVRSPAEFALDHIPGAINLPVLDDNERANVGTINAHESDFAAKRLGAALVTKNISRILKDELARHEPGWRPLVYCWRGGNRSMSLATVLARIGWRTHVLDGGYKNYRRWVVQSITELAPRLHWRVIAGRTGTGKSRILQALAHRGVQVLDLEELANHRGSVLGLIPDTSQPSQKGFDSKLVAALRRFNPEQPILVESESRKIGRVQLPEALITAMRAAPCFVVERSVASRAQFLIADYRHFLTDPQALLERLARLNEMHGAKRLAAWHQMIDVGDWPALVEALLREHYDPAYDRSMRRNFAQLDTASILTDESDEVLAASIAASVSSSAATVGRA